MRIAAIASMVLCLAACSAGGPTGTPIPAATIGSSISAEAGEFSFTPAQWTVPAAREISIAFANRGSTEHEWVIIKDQVQLASEADCSEDLVYFEVESLPAGETTTETFTSPSAGTYQIICALPGHFSGGMKGVLRVVP